MRSAGFFKEFGLVLKNHETIFEFLISSYYNEVKYIRNEYFTIAEIT